MDRGRKRPEVADQLPADKRACSSSEFRPVPICTSASAAAPSSSASTVPPPSSSEPADCEMESSSSGRGGGDSAYGSCDSDDDHHFQPRGGCGTSRVKFQRIISCVEGDDAGPSSQVAALTELCEALSFCIEDSFDHFPVEATVPVLVRLAGSEGNPDIMLLAIRAITYLCDVMPRSADALVRHGVLPVLCGRLLAIEYLDVAEQSLQALEKISRKQPVPCLQAGTIMAVLGFIDFFSTSVQRVALSTVANVCKKLPSDCSVMVLEAVPTLCNLLQYDDCKLVETALTCLIRITDCFCNSSEILDELCKHGIINKSLHLMTIDGRTTISQSTFMGLIGLLTKLASVSLIAVTTLFELGVSIMLKKILMAPGLLSETSYSNPEGVHYNQVHEVLKLLNQLVPSAATDDANIQLVLAKEKILGDQATSFQQFSADMLPILIEVVKSGASLRVCYGCISCINNIIYFSSADMLEDVVKNSNIASFLASLLARKDHHLLISALKIVELLMRKLPHVFSSSFVKEGVVHSIDLICNEQLQLVGKQSYQQDNQVASQDVFRCLCYAFDSPNASSSERKSCKHEKDAPYNLAKKIKATYFSDTSENCERCMSEILKKLKLFCTELNENIDCTSYIGGCAQTEEHLCQLLGQIMAEINSGDVMSSFEFIESGIVRSLAHYLSNGRYLHEAFSGCTSSLCPSILKRLQQFLGILLSKDLQNSDQMLLTSLTQKLQNALSSVDDFPVIMSQFFKCRSSYSDVPTRHATLHPCLKVRFVREEGELQLSDYSEIVSIELSLSFDSIARYLWPKVNTSMRVEHRELKGKDVTETSITVSGSTCQEEMIGQEPLHRMLQKLPDSHRLESRIKQEQQSSVEDTSMKLQEMMTESNCNSSSSDGGRTEGRNFFCPCNDDSSPKLVFSIEGKELDKSTTLYQAILQFQINVETDIVVGPKFWTDVYKVSYRRAVPNVIKSDASCGDLQSSLFEGKTGYPWRELSFVSTLLRAELPCKLYKAHASYDLLFIMKILEGLNHFSSYLLTYERIVLFAEGRMTKFDDLKVATPSIPQIEFINRKLTDKLEQQMQDPLASSTGSMPSWCDQLIKACPFLFSFEVRCKYFRLNAFGPGKIQLNQVQILNNAYFGSASVRRPSSGWSHRKKFRVNRSDILESAAKMMASHSQSKVVVEVEYDDEVGTGLGPTMEFFTLVSHEFQKTGMDMWRDSGLSSDIQTSKYADESALVYTDFGLFPRPWSAPSCELDECQFSDVIKKFFLLGQFIAMAIKDGRILDITFSRSFYKLMLHQELGIYDIQSFDPELGKTLLEFQALCYRKRFLESAYKDNLKDDADLCFRSTKIEDLCLDFTLPGYTDYALSSANDSKMVNISNLEEFVSLVVDATINGGISKQVQAFESGFNEVFPMNTLQIFSEAELELLLCGERDTWTFSDLLDHVKFDHGYTASSPPIINLLETIQEFTSDQQRAFLQFVTGAPRLPPGGLAALNPKLTIVRKVCNYEVDMDLPSVMTCANYLKLPPYSTKERMKQRMLYAITEGQGSFHLS
ncbi:E3 ubiquitin-protein ligase UPL4 [Apostasia shenzhenica]|uniref:HECT-type E3 ubiquitin transferase n=1 Tax=Apostasia shenzhenica TaxID=1088818 RepID=A0A2I0A8P2_9ASPA|nr:E3 ubiquitin-protein ligase UPL4 [Apostasia shenzhenica]